MRARPKGAPDPPVTLTGIGAVHERTRPTRLGGAVVALAVIAVLAAACEPEPEPLYPKREWEGPTGGPRLGLVGHSVPNASHAELATELRLSRVAAMDTTNGWTIPDASDAIDWLVSAEADVAVVDLGENELGSNVSQATLRARTIETLDRLSGIRCVVWVDIREDVDPVAGPNWAQEAAAFNAWLLTEAAGRTNTHVARWSVWSAGHDDWFLADGLHPSPAGRAAYAAFVHAQVDEFCGGPTAANPVTEDPPIARTAPEAGPAAPAPTVPPTTAAIPSTTAVEESPAGAPTTTTVLP